MILAGLKPQISNLAFHVGGEISCWQNRTIGLNIQTNNNKEHFFDVSKISNQKLKIVSEKT